MVIVGLDTGRDEHKFAVLDSNRKVLWEGRLPNQTAQFHGWRVAIEARCKGKPTVAVETRGGFASPLDQYLEEHGWKVSQLTPEAVGKYREFVLGEHNKTDAKDAYAAACLELERTKSKPTKTRPMPRRLMRRITRRYQTLIEDRTSKVNDLRKTVALLWPEANSKVLPDLTAAWIVALLQDLPDPQQIAQLDIDGLRAVLKARGMRSPYRKTIVSVLGAARANVAAPAEKPFLLLEVRMLATQIQALGDAIKLVEAEVEALYRQDEDAKAVAAVKGVSAIQATTFVAELQTVSNYPSESDAASYAGLGLADVQTGKTKNGKRIQWRCNRRLKRCMYGVAETRRLNDAASSVYYNRKVAEGKNHRQALRCLARHIFRMLFRILKRLERQQARS